MFTLPYAETKTSSRKPLSANGDNSLGKNKKTDGKTTREMERNDLLPPKSSPKPVTAEYRVNVKKTPSADEVSTEATNNIVALNAVTRESAAAKKKQVSFSPKSTNWMQFSEKIQPTANLWKLLMGCSIDNIEQRDCSDCEHSEWKIEYVYSSDLAFSVGKRASAHNDPSITILSQMEASLQKHLRSLEVDGKLEVELEEDSKKPKSAKFIEVILFCLVHIRVQEKISEGKLLES
ncbi:hypothetical protein F5876DRAFT_68796 [Lentinula aff. lateritia]|uniref:Uncharacterized protein n=1 Tax=Lentinula aff. lateritia TaxID=2804960 RepID=A0ACC1TPI7_9AGAR|nr:hypothetical protein F5876DRAFT_68796 [Lentinula aff. lateritia]